MARPIIALLTDFGLRDHYVGTMKGVVLGICPEATLVDITHEIPSYDRLAAALELEAASRYFPPRTIFLAVVDPGVGSARRAIAVETGGRLFVGPDNGILSGVVDDEEPWRGVELTERRYQLPEVSRTFEGRDRFAPAAAWLASGVEVTALGRAIASIERLEIPSVRSRGDVTEGNVLRVDRFGNLITNIPAEILAGIEHPTIDVGGQTITTVTETYANVAEGRLCALVGSTGRLEIAVSGGSAADRLGVGRGALVHLRRGA